MLVLLRGQPGTGKSTIANALGNYLGFVVVDKDDIKDVIDDDYQINTGGLSYDVMLRIAKRNLSLGLSVICDSPLTYPDLYTASQRMAKEHDHEIYAIRTVCSDKDEWARRLSSRQGMPAHRKTSLSEEMTKTPILYDINNELTIDTAKPLNDCLFNICTHLKIEWI